GRERELVELHQLLYRTRALTLCGPGGIGKTRLALRLLASVAAEFPDGIWFVELADLPQHDLQQADLVVSRIASVIGITEEAGRPVGGGDRGGPSPRRPAQPPSATKRSGCSPTGPRPPSPASPSGRTTSRPSPRSAARWTGCRWRSSWPRPGSGRCRWSRSRA